MTAERLGPEVRELTLGKSFFSNKNKSNSSGNFHTIRYDFKPASVDSSKMGVIEVGDKQSVNVSVPHSNQGQTNYSGHVKQSGKKDCILIIDHQTGKITLEKVSSQILIKKTRDEKQEVPTCPHSSPVGTPAEPAISRRSASASARTKNSPKTLASENSVCGGSLLFASKPSANKIPSKSEEIPVKVVEAQASSSQNSVRTFSSSSSDTEYFSSSDSDDTTSSDEPKVQHSTAMASTASSSSSYAKKTPIKVQSMPSFGRNGKTDSDASSMPQLLNDDLQLSSESSDEWTDG